MTELLSCPFCGGAHIDFFTIEDGNDNVESAYVQCFTCDARNADQPSVADAIKNWNTRALAQGAQDTKACMDMLEDIPGETLRDRVHRLVDWYQELSKNYHRDLAAAQCAPQPNRETVGNADAVREKIARIIDSYGWNWLDGVVRPFAENRGAQEGDQCEFYGMAWRDGVRTAVEARDWCLNKANHTVRHGVLESLRHADAILAGPLAALSSAPVGGAVSCAAREALEQISAVCADNAGDECDQKLALRFVKNVADRLLSLPAGGEASKREAEIVERCAKVVEAQAVGQDGEPISDPTDISYNFAIDHAAAAVRALAVVPDERVRTTGGGAK
jgi:Lar family restriction alleviation protein